MWFHSTIQVVFRTWRAADCRPYGHAGGRYRSFARVIYATLLGDESSPLHCVVPFNRTGSIRNAAPLRPLFKQHFTPPRGPHQARPGEPASPKGSSCTVLLGGRSNGTGHRRCRTVNCQLSTVNFRKIVNCPLSIVNFLPSPHFPSTQKSFPFGKLSTLIPDSGAWSRPRRC